MSKTGKCIFLFFLLLNTVQAQNTKPPFWDDIQSFKRQDSIDFPGTGKILFAGSSSFAKWTDLQNYFPGYPVTNRGFGGSSLTDLIRYREEVIFTYHPKQIVLYCGENDIAASDTVSGKLVFERFQQLFSYIRNRLGNVPLIYISMKPSPLRWQMKDRMTEGNALIKGYLEKQPQARFVSVWEAMLGPDGKPVEALFIADKLHLNAKGYAIWKNLIEPYLQK